MLWFQVVEIGLSDEGVKKFMPIDLYQKARNWSAAVARKAGNNTRATMEALVFQDETG
jgi:hypothetical protein